MKKLFLLVVIFAVAVSCVNGSDNADIDSQPTKTYYKGMDLSFLPELETLGTQFKNENNTVIANNYTYLASKGVNLVRLRLWVNHPNQAYNLTKLKAQATLVKAAGMDFLLDFHYSDTWADPGNQQTPAAWSGLNASELAASVALYTDNVLRELIANQTPPQIIQIGNETNNGFLWPVGQVFNTTGTNWDNYANITKAAINAARSVTPSAKIMIHYAGVEYAGIFYQELVARNVSFDIAGLSYYPWWHGSSLTTMELQLNTLAGTITQDLMIVETAYPFTLGFNDNTNNVIGLQSQVAPSYPANIAGQRDFLRDLNTIIKNIPDERGTGFCYWAPDWVAHTPSQTSFTQGSSWENLALFDFNNKVNPAIVVYGND